MVRSSLEVFLIALTINLVSAHLLCYDCDAGPDCEEPRERHVRTVNCASQYPNATRNNDKLICLTLSIKLLESRGFSFYKTGLYRGCNVIPSSVKEEEFCDYMKNKHDSDRLVIRSCNFCNSTRCLN